MPRQFTNSANGFKYTCLGTTRYSLIQTQQLNTQAANIPKLLVSKTPSLGVLTAKDRHVSINEIHPWLFRRRLKYMIQIRVPPRIGSTFRNEPCYSGAKLHSLV